MPPDPRVHAGVAAVVPWRGKLLMIQRGGTGRWSEQGKGSWSVPGGWLDLGESPAQAAVREVHEETNAEVKAILPRGYVQNMSEGGDFSIVTLFMECQLTGSPEDAQVTEPDKCPAVEWVPFEEVPFRPLFLPLQLWLQRHNMHVDEAVLSR
jgi:ADP-ribose pyrophosphatase YjhB (NUDIX family)